MRKIPAQELERIGTKLLDAAGSPHEESKLVTEMLVRCGAIPSARGSTTWRTTTRNAPHVWNSPRFRIDSSRAGLSQSASLSQIGHFDAEADYSFALRAVAPPPGTNLIGQILSLVRSGTTK